MRNPMRLNSFYQTLRVLHKTYYPDLRFGQLMYNFSIWHSKRYGIDLFYLEENDFLIRFTKFIGEDKNAK